MQLYDEICQIFTASGFFNTKEIAEDYVYTGVGLLAGTSILLLTILWGTCVIAGRQHFTNNQTSNDSNSSTAFSWERLPAILTGRPSFFLLNYLNLLCELWHFLIWY